MLFRSSLPSHASDMLSARLQAIGGTRTSTSQDSQLCRLLTPLPSFSERDRVGFRGSWCESTRAPLWARPVSPAYRVGPSRPRTAKALPVPTDDGRRFDDKDAGLPVFPDGAKPSPQESIRRSQFRSLAGALENAELMAESEDLELKRRAAPEGSEKRSQESRQ